MVSFFLRTFALLIFFFSTFGSCLLQLEDTPFNSLRPPPGWRFGNRALLARGPTTCDPNLDDPDVPDCRTLCGGAGSPCVAGSLKKRNLRIAKQLEISNLTDLTPREFNRLWKRVFVAVNQGQLADYLVNQLDSDGVPDVRYGRPARLIDGDAEDQDNIVVQTQFGANPFQIGTNALCGCSIVTVVSNQAVYMGHFFENPSWGSTTAFQSMVLNFFGGNVAPVGTGQQINAALFPAASTRVYIMTPRKGTRNARSSNYPVKVRQLLAQIQNTLNSPPIAVYNYVPMDCDEFPGQEDSPPNPDLFTSQQGCALFQFDPQGDPNGNPAWRIFYENHQFQSTDPQPGPDAINGIPDV